MNKIYVGIDLGTTNSLVASFDPSGHAVVAPNSDGDRMTPSVVTVTSKSTYEVGKEPKKALYIDSCTFSRFKREMGTDKTYKAYDKSFTPTSLSAAVLSQLKADTLEDWDEEVAEAVVTIPANFPNEARKATLAAAKKAGIDVQWIINEPTAAAIAFAHQSKKQLHGNYVVFDLGGGTFDLSVVKVVGDSVKVLHSEGVRRLGGDDFDRALMELVHQRYEEKTGKKCGKDDFNQNDAEEQKHTLSKREKVVCRVNGKGGRVNIEVSRDEFELAIATYLSQIEMLSEKALVDAGVAVADVNEVLLVGGSTRVPSVVRTASKVFQKTPAPLRNPDEAVAEGAAIYAAYKSDRAHLNTVQRRSIENLFVKDITNKHFGTLCLEQELSGERHHEINSLIIEKGTPIPALETRDYFTVADNQTSVNCVVTECALAERDPAKVKTVWEGSLTGLPSHRPRGQKIEITYGYDENQIMQCHFVDVGSGRKMEVDLNLAECES